MDRPRRLAGLTIWASGVTLGELRAEEGDESLFCFNNPFQCEHFGGECYGHCIKDLLPGEVTCCIIEFPE